MNNDFKKLAEIMESELSDYETGKELANQISRTYNYFGNHCSDTKEMYSSLSKKAKKRFLAVISLSSLALSYRYKLNKFEEWDDRKRASVEFSYRNEEFFEKLLKESSGLDVEYRDTDDEIYSFSNAVDWRKQDKEHYEFIENYISTFLNDHPTLIQSFVRGFVAVLEELYPKKDFGNTHFFMY